MELNIHGKSMRKSKDLTFDLPFEILAVGCLNTASFKVLICPSA